jgi:hypothetical protein
MSFKNLSHLSSIERNLQLIEPLYYAQLFEAQGTIITLLLWSLYVGFLVKPTKDEDHEKTFFAWLCMVLYNVYFSFWKFLYEKILNISFTKDEKNKIFFYTLPGLILLIVGFNIMLGTMINQGISRVSSTLEELLLPKTYYCDESGPHPQVDFRDHSGIHHRMGAEKMYWDRQFHNFQKGNYDVPKFTPMDMDGIISVFINRLGHKAFSRIDQSIGIVYLGDLPEIAELSTFSTG